jgi:hypothetical protein
MKIKKKKNIHRAKMSNTMENVWGGIATKHRKSSKKIEFRSNEC